MGRASYQTFRALILLFHERVSFFISPISFDNESIFSTALILEDGLVSSNTTMDFKDASHDLQRC